MHDARFIQAHAAVRYWEDGWLNGTQDSEGTVPLRVGDDWQPIIELATGRVLDWPEGVELRTCYKVADAGEYWLLGPDRNRICKWKGAYVPAQFFDQANSGAVSDYIVLHIGADGIAKGWKQPFVDTERWVPV